MRPEDQDRNLEGLARRIPDLAARLAGKPLGGAAGVRAAADDHQPVAGALGDGLFVSDGALWRERRRVVAPVTHPTRLPELAPAITEAAAERAAAWRRHPPDAPLDVLGEMGRLTAEIICRTIFGRALGADAAAEVVGAFAEYQDLVDQTDLLSLAGLPDWLPRPRGRRIRAAVARIHAVVDRLIAEILDGGGAEASLIRAMSRACSSTSISSAGAESSRPSRLSFDSTESAR